MSDLKMISAQMILAPGNEIIFDAPVFHKSERFKSYKKLLKKMELKNAKVLITKVHVELLLYGKKVVAIAKESDDTNLLSWIHFDEKLEKIPDLSSFIEKFYGK